MTTTITDAFDLPRPEDIRAMGFVVKLRESDPGSDEVKQLVDDYVITPAIERELPRILDDMKQVFDRGEEYGRFIHGSFGSGKSHFMTMLSLLLEGTQPAWKKFRPLLNAHKDSQASKGRDSADHEAWLAKAGLLVVRIHMLSVRGKSTGFDRAVYEGFNAALKRRNKAPFEFLNVDAIFEEVRREAKEYGDIVWKRLEAESIVGGREDFEAIASGSTQARERFARTWLKYKGRDAADARIDPRWSDGLSRMAEHAKAQGFGGIVLMIDEFLLWLAEKSGQEFVQEINNLNVIVDHNTGQRPAPIFVFVARQRNLQEFFPDLVDESKIHEHLDHHAKRFEILQARGGRVTGDIACVAADLHADARFDMLAQLVTGRRDYSPEQNIRDVVENDAVSNHPLHRYSATGLVKCRAWEKTWHDQRGEDLREAVVPPVPPTYAQPDFVSRRVFELRGKLDVPKERFIAFTEVPGRSGVETLYGWAGWTAQQRVKAILAIDEELEDAAVPLADRIGLLDSAWRLLLDVAREDAAAATRLKAELQALVGPEGPSRELIEDWKKRFPPPTTRATGAAKLAKGGKRGAKKAAEEDDEASEEDDE